MQPHQNYWKDIPNKCYTSYRTTIYSLKKKCEFNKEKVEYLGLVIEEGKFSTDPVKVKGFADWPIPKSVKDVRSFLGFGNFYRKFIPKFSTLAALLNNLLKKDTAFEWMEETQ